MIPDIWDYCDNWLLGIGNPTLSDDGSLFKDGNSELGWKSVFSAKLWLGIGEDVGFLKCVCGSVKDGTLSLTTFGVRVFENC